MAKPLVSDELWAVIEPLLPQEPPKPKGGRPRSVGNRAALAGILFVLQTGIAWETLPQETGCGSGMTCWRAGYSNGSKPVSGPSCMGCSWTS